MSDDYRRITVRSTFFFLVAAMSMALLLQGCASMAASSVNTQNMKGIDVDKVISDVEKEGFQCGKKRSSKSVNSDKITGDVGCSLKDKAIVCPVSHDLSIIFDLVTNKVTWAGQFQRQHCF